MCQISGRRGRRLVYADEMEMAWTRTNGSNSACRTALAGLDSGGKGQPRTTWRETILGEMKVLALDENVP